MLQPLRQFSLLFPVALCPVALCPVALPAQHKPDARSFVPPEPSSEVMVDFKALRETGVWDGVTVSIVNTLLPLLERELGFRLVHLDRLRMFPETRDWQREVNNSPVVIFEGTAELLPPAGREGTSLAKCAGHEVVVEPMWRDADDPNWWVQPKPGVLVYGPQRQLEPGLTGARAPGVTPPELLSLVAGRAVLAHMVGSFSDGAKAEFLRMLEAEAVPAPDFMMARVRIDPPSQDEDEPIVHLESRLRWPDGSPGPEAMGAHLRTSLEKLQKHPRLAALKQIWRKVEIVVDGRDLVAHMNLGRPRDAGGLVALAAPVLLFTASTVEMEAAAPVGERQIEEPPPPPKPAPPVPGQPGRGGE